MYSILLYCLYSSWGIKVDGTCNYGVFECFAPNNLCIVWVCPKQNITSGLSKLRKTKTGDVIFIIFFSLFSCVKSSDPITIDPTTPSKQLQQIGYLHRCICLSWVASMISSAGQIFRLKSLWAVRWLGRSMPLINSFNFFGRSEDGERFVGIPFSVGSVGSMVPKKQRNKIIIYLGPKNSVIYKWSYCIYIYLQWQRGAIFLTARNQL